MTSAEEALKKVLHSALVNNALWDTRVSGIELIAATAVKPYVVFFVASNVRVPMSIRKKNVVIEMSIKGVAVDVATAYAIQDAIGERLDDSGTQDYNPRLPIDPDWYVTTVTQTRAIWLQENFSPSTTFYHAGHVYRVTMERKT